MKHLFSLAFSLFLLMDSIGNIPLFITLLKNTDPKKHTRIIFRELLIALFVIICFYFIGDELMDFLKIGKDTIQIAGGIILFLICLKMIFPPPQTKEDSQKNVEEPYIVPLAIPLVAGPSVLAAVMIYADQETNNLLMIGAILLAWIGTLIILLLASKLKKILGWRGICALERLMGLILALISIEMFLSGVKDFLLHASK
jgi:multiple antibiotic resistance protein